MQERDATQAGAAWTGDGPACGGLDLILGCEVWM